MTTPTDLEQTRQGIEELVGMAVRAATSLEEVVDCARAAASMGSPELLERVAARVAYEVHLATASSDAWEAARRSLEPGGPGAVGRAGGRRRGWPASRPDLSGGPGPGCTAPGADGGTWPGQDRERVPGRRPP